MVVNRYFAFKCAYSTTKEVARAKTTGGGGGGGRTSRCTNSPKQPTSTAPPPTPTSHPRPLMHHAASFCALKTLTPPGTKDMSFGLIHLSRAGILRGFCALGGDRWDLKSRLSRPRSPPSSRRAPRLENRQFIETVHGRGDLLRLFGFRGAVHMGLRFMYRHCVFAYSEFSIFVLLIRSAFLSFFLFFFSFSFLCGCSTTPVFRRRTAYAAVFNSHATWEGTFTLRSFA